MNYISSENKWCKAKPKNKELLIVNTNISNNLKTPPFGKCIVFSFMHNPLGQLDNTTIVALVALDIIKSNLKAI